MRRSKSFFLLSPAKSLAIALLLALAGLCGAVPITYAQEAAFPGGWVVLSVDEYRALRSSAFPGERLPEAPPVDATLTRVDYDLHIRGGLATGRASLTVDVIKDGWVRVAIPGGLLVRDAHLDGKLVSLVPASFANKPNHLSAVLSHPGRSVLLLDIALPVNVSAGEESLALPASASGVTRASVTLPRQGVEVQLAGGLLAEKSESASESKWLAYGKGNEPLTFTWRRKLEDHHLTLPLRMRGALRELVGLGEDATSVYAEVDLQVLQGAAREAKIQLPGAVTINQVAGAMVADWEVSHGELTITFLEPVEQSARFVIHGETRTPRQGKISVPLLRLLNSERESGGVAVEVLGAGEIKGQTPQGLENADASELGATIAGRQSPSMIAYRFRPGPAAAPRSLNVDVARYAQQAVLMANIEEARYNALMSDEGKTLVQARYAVRNNARNFLKVSLPTGAVVWSATVSGRPVRPGQAPDGSLLLPLEKSRAGDDARAFAVEVLYLARQAAWSEKGSTRLLLPAVDLPISRSAVVLYHAPQFHVTPERGAFREETYVLPASAALNPGASAEFSASGAVHAPQPAQANELKPEMQSLMDSFRNKSSGGRSARVLPVNISFPAIGPSIFLVSELTAENQSPQIELSYQRDKKAGRR